MDNLTHTLFAATLARTPLRRAGRGTTAVLLLASNAPDIDIIATAGGALKYLEWHRGPSHGPFGIVGMGTPIDADTTAVFFWRYRRVQGWERDVWRFLYRTVLEERHWEVLEQDRVMLEGMAPDADAAENLYQHDLGVMRLRRLYRARAEELAAATAEP